MELLLSGEHNNKAPSNSEKSLGPQNSYSYHLHHHFKSHHKPFNRFVYNDISIPLYRVLSINQLFLALRHVVQGLEALYRTSRVHGDVNPSNILVVGDQGILFDLEYANPMVTEGNHRVRTGTFGFMALDIEANNYIVGPPLMWRGPPPLIHNYLHDLESVWWVGIWSLAWSFPEQNDGNTYQSTEDNQEQQPDYASNLFDIDNSLFVRGGFFLLSDQFEEIALYLPSQFRPHLSVLALIRTLLFDSYKAHLAGDVIHEEVFTDIHSKFGAELDAAQELMDFNIYPLRTWQPRSLRLRFVGGKAVRI